MRTLFIALSFMLLTIWIGSSGAVDVEGKKTDTVIKIETDMYKLEWKTARQAGYISAWVKKGDSELLLFEGVKTGRRFYHSSNYGGAWKDWGTLDDFKIIEKKGGVAKVEFTMTDGTSKDYICTATFWDGYPLIRHEVKIKAKANVTSWESGHEPMYEVWSPIKGSQKWDAGGGSLGMLRSGPRTHFLPFMQQTQPLSFGTTQDGRCMVEWISCTMHSAKLSTKATQAIRLSTGLPSGRGVRMRHMTSQRP